jgi:hypothetical protein
MNDSLLKVVNKMSDDFNKLSRMEKRHAILPEYPDVSIPDICINFRQAMNGAADPPTTKNIIKTIRFLECCLATWDYSYILSKDFDDCVKRMIELTLIEVENAAC